MNSITRLTSVPFTRADTKIVLFEGISPTAVDLLETAGYTGVTRHKKALEGDALVEAVRGAHILGIRSRTQLSEPVLRSAGPLMAVGCFCIGTDQVDLQAARGLGIPVFNAPFSNNALRRRTHHRRDRHGCCAASRRARPAAHAGEWDKSADGSYEVRGKTLGIVGYGNIGSQLSTLAEAMGMRVIYYDRANKLRHGNTQPVSSLDDLLAASDVVSLHVPDLPSTQNLIGPAEVAAMKNGSVLINNSRGRVVDLESLAAAIREGRVAGAAVDVFPSEPKAAGDRLVTPLQGLENVILTPHIGGSTMEAQERIGEEVAQKLLEFLNAGTTMGAVNFPNVDQPADNRHARYLHVHKNVPGVLGKLNAVFSSRGLNVHAQSLQTDGELGYVIVDADSLSGQRDEVLDALCAIEGTVRARVVG